MNIQESDEFKTSKFYCKTDFDMAEIKKEEADYENYPLPKFYTFKSKGRAGNGFSTETSWKLGRK